MFKSTAFLYSNNEVSEKDVEKIIPFAISTKRIKYLGINLMKHVKDLYNENYKTLLKETEEDNKEMERYSVFLDWKYQHR